MLNVKRNLKAVLGFLAMFVVTLHQARPADASDSASWRMAGQNVHNTRHQSAERVIGPDTASKLVVKWKKELEGNIMATPAVAEGSLYLPDSDGNLYKIDAGTGGIIWQKKITQYTGIPNDLAVSTPFLTESSLLLGNQPPCTQPPDCGRAIIMAIDKRTGELLWKRQIHGFPGSIVTQSGTVRGTRAYFGVSSDEEGMASIPGYKCCSFRGKMLSLDKNTGDLKAAFHTVPDIPGYSGGSVWGSTPVIDAHRGTVYITTGNNYSVPKRVEKCILECINSACDTEQVRACLNQDRGNHFESILALDLNTLRIKWAFQAMLYDAWNETCITGENPQSCPEPTGTDFDFAQGPALITVKGNRSHQLVGAGQKSDVYWALDPNTGNKVWHTRVGPGGGFGGMQWGSATDGERIYVASANSLRNLWTLKGNGTQAGFVITRGFWSSLDAMTGKILWQTPEPDEAVLRQPVTSGANAWGPVGPMTVANGVVFGGTTTPGHNKMFALDAKSGAILWTFASDGVVKSGAAVVDGVVYWGTLAPVKSSTESHTTYGTNTTLPQENGTLFAFCVAGSAGCPVASSD